MVPSGGVSVVCSLSPMTPAVLVISSASIGNGLSRGLLGASGDYRLLTAQRGIPTPVIGT